MPGSAPPAGSSRNSSQHIDPGSTATTQNPAPPTAALGPTTINSSTMDLDRIRDDINAMRTRCNDQRALKRLANETTSDNEDLLSNTNLINTISTRNNPPPLSINTQLPPSTTNSNPTLSPSAHTTTPLLPNDTSIPPPNNSMLSLTTMTKPFAFADDVAKKNKQLEMLEMIPDQILTMVRERVYVPLSFFLADSLDRIRLDQDLKSHKSISRGIHIYNPDQFPSEEDLDQVQFQQAYHNFM
ncbi:hypothetical protein K439DRAFT_1505095 [Ramaria rubella]|nr:hypothetical protein K439DRAFT_1505095 [Ramaria rubella]